MNKTPPNIGEFMNAMEKDFQEQIALAEEIALHDPSLGITAFIMAGDIMSGRKIDKAIEAGVKIQGKKLTYEKGVSFVGSFARFEWVIEKFLAKKISTQFMRNNIAHLWSGSDPDDTDPKYLQVWRDVWVSNWYHPILSGKKLPTSKRLTLFRGQDVGAKVGIAWSLDIHIANKFAKGAGVRQSHRNGEILTGVISRDNVIAYITGRGEEEIIVDPSSVDILDRHPCADYLCSIPY